MERDLAQPRLNSLHRIARALGTSAQALLSGTTRATRFSLVRAGDNYLRIDERPDSPQPGLARSLVEGSRGLTALEFTQPSTEFGPAYEHPGEELLIVAKGYVEVEIDGALIELGPGDCICYPGELPHRSRAVRGEVLIYLVTTRQEDA